LKGSSGFEEMDFIHETLCVDQSEVLVYILEAAYNGSYAYIGSHEYIGSYSC
jgi:hypothetical protein